MIMMLTISKQINDQERINLNDWQLLAQVSQIFRTVSETFTDQVDIPRGQATLLCAIARQDGLTQSEIAERMSVQGATVSSMLRRLEEAGLVTRRRDPEDNRLVRVSLTDEGLQKEQAINAQIGNMQELMFKGLSDEERAVLLDLLNRVIDNITPTS